MSHFDLSEFRSALEYGAVRSVTAYGVFPADGVADGWEVWVALENVGDRRLSVARGHPRVFASLDTVRSFLAGLGVRSFAVDWSSQVRLA